MATRAKYNYKRQNRTTISQIKTEQKQNITIDENRIINFTQSACECSFFFFAMRFTIIYNTRIFPRTKHESHFNRYY